MNVVCVIIARAGSKGLKNKTLRELAGKPLVAWTIEHALGSRRTDHVVLTTDSPEALAIGRRYGIHCYERPTELAGDAVTVDEAARHGVACWEKQFNQVADYVVILYGNVPLRPADLTDRAVDKLVASGCDSVQSVYPVGKMHPYWMKKLEGESGDVLTMYEENQVYRRQDLPPVFMLDGGVIAVPRRNFWQVDKAQPHKFLGRDRRGIETQPGEVVDIDCELDLRMAEAILAERAAQQRLAEAGNRSWRASG
jgi:CMP-N-acetylneuraminic acid synthetase